MLLDHQMTLRDPDTRLDKATMELYRAMRAWYQGEMTTKEVDGGRWRGGGGNLHGRRNEDRIGSDTQPGAG